MPDGGADPTPQAEPFQGLLERLARNPARTVPMIGARKRAAERGTIVTPVDLAAAPASLPRGPRPWLSGSASILLWGGGQWLNRDRNLAFLFLLLEALALSWAWCLAAAWRSWVRLGWIFFIDELTLRTAAAVAGLAIPAVGILTVAQAYLRAERRPGARAFSGHLILSGAASALVPGWGQLLNGQIGKAILYLTIWGYGLYLGCVSQLQPAMWARIDPSVLHVGSVRLSTLSATALIGAALSWVLAIYDAILTGRGLQASPRS